MKRMHPNHGLTKQELLVEEERILREAYRKRKIERIKKRLCTYPSCDRKATKGRTTCQRHYTAGGQVKHVLMNLERRNENG